MAIGIEQRERLAQQIQEQYREKPTALQIAGMELALRAHARWEKRFDQGLLSWEQLQEQRGKTNGVVVGIARALHEQNGWNLTALKMWKKYHTPYWTIIEEPAFIREALQPYTAKAIPTIIANNMPLNVFHKAIVSYQQQSDPTKRRSAKSALDKLFSGMVGTSLEDKAKDLLALTGESQEPRYGWLDQIPETKTAASVSNTSIPSEQPPKKVGGLRKAADLEVEDAVFRDLPPEALDMDDSDIALDVQAALQQAPISQPSPPPSGLRKTGGLRKATPAEAVEDALDLEIASALEVQGLDSSTVQHSVAQSLNVPTSSLKATPEHTLTQDDIDFLASMEM